MIQEVYCCPRKMNKVLCWLLPVLTCALGNEVFVDRDGRIIPDEYLRVRRILDSDPQTNIAVPCDQGTLEGGCTVLNPQLISIANGGVSSTPGKYGYVQIGNDYSGVIGNIDYNLTDPMVAPPKDGSPYGMHITPESNTDFIFSWQAGASWTGAIFSAPNVSQDPACTTANPRVLLGISSGMYTLSFPAECVKFVRDYSHADPTACNSLGCWNYLSPYLFHARVTGLLPGQTYYYVVGDTSFRSSERTLTTLSATRQYPFVIAAMADIGQVHKITALGHDLSCFEAC